MIFIVISFLIMGLCSGWMDTIKNHWHRSPDWMKKRSRYWNPAKWYRKWKKDENGTVLVGRERFPFSSTLLVSFVSGWHLLKEVWISTSCLMASYLLNNLAFYFIFRLSFFLGFAINYYKMKAKIKIWHVFAVIVAMCIAALIFNAIGVTSWSDIF